MASVLRFFTKQEDEREHPEGLRRTGRFFGSVAEDYRKRAKFLASDYKDGMAMKTLSAALYMFFSTFSSTVALGEMVRRTTGSRIGISEYLAVNSLMGMTHALIGCQPLLVLRPTGPISAIIIALYGISDSNPDIDFFQLMAWTGMWVGVYMVLIAAFDLCCLIRHLTRFTHDLFAFFICTIYITDGLLGAYERLESVDSDFGEALFAAVLFVLTFGVALTLEKAKSSTLFFSGFRKFLHDYALPLAVATTVIVSYMASSVDVERVPMPDHLSPTYSPETDSEDYVPETRDWTVGLSLSRSPGYLPLVAAVAAVPVILLFFIDQNVSSRLTQVKEMRLTKGAYYNSSFLLMGIFNIVGPMFGLPYVTGSLPHSPQFAQALTEYSASHPAHVLRVRENRLAPFLMYLLIGATLFVPSVLELIPEGAVDGILTFVGFAGLFGGNQLVHRIGMLFRDPAHYPNDTPYASLPARRVHLFTAVQLALFVVCWAVKLSPYGLAFPVIIVSLIPFRKKLLTKMFTDAELARLDSAEHADDAGSDAGSIDMEAGNPCAGRHAAGTRRKSRRRHDSAGMGFLSGDTEDSYDVSDDEVVLELQNLSSRSGGGSAPKDGYDENPVLDARESLPDTPRALAFGIEDPDASDEDEMI